MAFLYAMGSLLLNEGESLLANAGEIRIDTSDE